MFCIIYMYIVFKSSKQCHDFPNNNTYTKVYTQNTSFFPPKCSAQLKYKGTKEGQQ